MEALEIANVLQRGYVYLCDEGTAKFLGRRGLFVHAWAKVNEDNGNETVLILFVMVI